jgi:membrane-associated phospholipid phosphatase
MFPSSTPPNHAQRIASGSRRSVLLVALGVCLASQSCVAPRPDNSRYDRHFESGVWQDALAQQTSRPDRLWPEAVLLGTVPVAFLLDSTLNEDSPQAPVASIDKTAADSLPVALTATGLAIGGFRWAGGDHGESFEAGVESTAAVAALTQIMKVLVARPRPDGGSNDSYPSGHTSFSFAGATLIARELEDLNDTEWNPYELLLYVPAVYVGIERVRADQHWASDVAVGAFLGTFVTNWIWDAHFKRDDDERPTVFGTRHRFDWKFSGGYVDERPVFGIEIDF